MTTIYDARNMLGLARKEQAKGDLSGAALCAISAQRMANKCRASHGRHVAHAAHDMLDDLMAAATDQRDRSIIGGAIKESHCIGWDQ